MRFILIISFFIIGFSIPQNSYAACCLPPPPTCMGCGCSSPVGRCDSFCGCVSDNQTGTPSNPKTTLGHITDEFNKHRYWMVEGFFKDSVPNDPMGLLAAMQLMTEQLVATGMQQVKIIGGFFDAKHQLETQRLFQTMTAQAHKDYHPSKGLCVAGTISSGINH